MTLYGPGQAQKPAAPVQVNPRLWLRREVKTEIKQNETNHKKKKIPRGWLLVVLTVLNLWTYNWVCCCVNRVELLFLGLGRKLLNKSSCETLLSHLWHCFSFKGFVLISPKQSRPMHLCRLLKAKRSHAWLGMYSDCTHLVPQKWNR